MLHINKEFDWFFRLYFLSNNFLLPRLYTHRLFFPVRTLCAKYLQNSAFSYGLKLKTKKKWKIKKISFHSIYFSSHYKLFSGVCPPLYFVCFHSCLPFLSLVKKVRATHCVPVIFFSFFFLIMIFITHCSHRLQRAWLAWVSLSIQLVFISI